MPAFFQELAWWKLEPRNELLAADTGASEERTIDGRPASPLRVYWCLAEPGAQYAIYARGLASEVRLDLDAPAGNYDVRQYDPRTGAYQDLDTREGSASFGYHPPDAQDWVVVLRAG